MNTKFMFVLLSAIVTNWSFAQPPSPTMRILTEHLDADENRLADWPQLARYRDDNATVPAPKAGEPRVVFMGDSITDAWGRVVGEFFPGKPYINRGISGQTTAQMVIRMHPDVIALKPRAVVILAGTNDLAGNSGPATLSMIEDNLAAMTELAQANGIKVVLASLLPINDYMPTDRDRSVNHPPEKIVELNAWIKTYAQHKGAIYLNYYSALLDEKHALKIELSPDGLHPNMTGYAVMAPLAEQAIKQALAQ